MLLVPRSRVRQRYHRPYPYRYSPFRSPPRSFFCGFGGSAHVHYFGPGVRGRGEAGLVSLFSAALGTIRPVWGPGLSAFPSGFLGWGHYALRPPRIVINLDRFVLNYFLSSFMYNFQMF